MRTHHKILYAGLIGGLAALTLPLLAAESQKAAPRPVLKLQRGVDPAAKLDVLRDVIPVAKASEAKPEKLKGSLRLSGATWRLDVFGDGSSAEFTDADAFARSHASGVQPAQAMPRIALEALGRTFIDQKLSRLIVLQNNERLVLAATSQRTEGGVDAQGKNAYSAIVANRVVFTREIGGIPVVGAGSKVTVTFLNDGSLESFRYDWPTYKPGARLQTLAAPIDVLRRVQRVSGVRTRANVDQALKSIPDLQSITGPIKLGATVTLEDLTCGYYDPGFAVRDPGAPIQQGCYYHVLETRGEGDFVTTTGYSGAVPAATVFQRDARWPEVNVLSGRKTKERKGRNAGSSKKVEPVPPRPDNKGQ
jgi:hypothetical protein